MEMDSTKSNKFIVQYHDTYYDITEFSKKHPGGINSFKGLENSDMTNRFRDAPPHSDAAMYLMREYKIKDKKTNGLTNGNGYTNKKVIANQNGTLDHHNNNNNNNNLQNIQLDDSMEHLVDWSKPMLPQITNITKHYDEWVHKPVDRPLRLFGPWYLEMCTKTPWWIIPIFWIPNIVYLIYSEAYSTKNVNLKISAIYFYFFFGIFIWTFVEYSLHRWVFHVKTGVKSGLLCTFHFLIHGLHHKVPFDPYRLVFPPFPGVILASIFYLPVLAISPYPRITISGGLFGYLCYDMMHYYLHYGSPSIWHMHEMKRYHYQHHFAHQDIGFGISSPFWDVIFQTRIYLRHLNYKIKW